MLISNSVQADSLYSYVCRVLKPGDVNNAPAIDDYTQGTFVRIQVGNKSLVGVICDEVALNRDIGARGPRLAGMGGVERLSPDLLLESGTLLSIIALGAIREDGTVEQGIPTFLPEPFSKVHTMNDNEVRDFHCSNGYVEVTYLAHMRAVGTPLMKTLIVRLLTRLELMFPEEQSKLAVIRRQAVLQQQGWDR